MKKFKIFACASLLAILCLSGVDVVAQEATGHIEGRVVMEGKGVGAVAVLLVELKLTEVTDADGNFEFELRPGSYTLILTQGGNTLTHPLIVAQDKTTHVEIEVDWDLGVQEKVTVTAGAIAAAKIVDAPAAVTSVSEEQIERKAATGQVPKILEFTPGAEVTQSGLYDFNFNTRGFNSSLNRRVSTYIDGRDVGVVLLGAQEWSSIAGGLDDVAGLEFIRGPSAALYGANASSGVINITTKNPRDSMGNMLRITGGSISSFEANPETGQYSSSSAGDLAWNFRRAGALGRDWYYKVTAGMRNSGDYTVGRDPNVVFRPEYYRTEKIYDQSILFCRETGQEDCLPKEKPLFRDDNEIRFGSLRFDKYLSDSELLTFEGGISDTAGPVFQTGIGRVQNLDSQRPFFRFSYSNPRWRALAHYSSREGDQVNLNEGLPPVISPLLTDTLRYGFEGQANWSFAGDNVRLVVGAAATKEEVDTSDPQTGEQTVIYEAIEANREAIFSQVDWKLSEKIKFVFAGRVDWNTLHDTQFSPKAAMVYSIDPKNSIRLTYNQAFQVANYSEFFLHAKIAMFPIGGFVKPVCVPPLVSGPEACGITEDFIPILAVGQPDLKLEETEAWEVGYSGLFANRVFLTVDYYNSKNENFITDLVPQVGTVLGDVENCVDPPPPDPDDPDLVRRECPINAAYLPWVAPDEAENAVLYFDPTHGPITVAQAIRNAVDNSVGGKLLGFRLGQDLDGSTVVVGRTYTNIGQVDTQGIDLGVQYFISNAWSVQGSYSWFDFEPLTEDPEIRKHLLPNTPEHKASLSVSFVRQRWAASLSGRWVDGFRWSAGIFQGDIPTYATADLTASYQINDLMRVGLNVANLTDHVHHQTFGGDLLQRRSMLNMTFGWQ